MTDTKEFTRVEECLRLAMKGGPDYPDRGLTLISQTPYVEHVVNRLADFDLIYECQKSLAERSLKHFGPKSVGYNEDSKLLEKMDEIKQKIDETKPNKTQIAAVMLMLLVTYNAF